MRQLLRLGPARARREAGQDRVALVDHEGAPPRDLQRCVAGFRQVGEGLTHGRAGLEVVFGGDPAAVLLRQEGALGDAQQRIVGDVHVGLVEIDVIGGDQRHVIVVGPCHQSWLGRSLYRAAVALKLHIEAVAESLAHGVQHGAPFGRLPRREQWIDRAVWAAREQDQTLRARHDRLPRDGGVIRAFALQIGRRGQRHQVEPPGLVLGQEHDGRAAGPTLGRALPDSGHRQGAADDGLDPGVLGILRKFQRPEQIGAVGDGGGGHAGLGSQGADLVGLDRSLEQGIGGPDPQMDEGARMSALGHGPCPPALNESSPNQMGGGADHPNEPGHRRKGHGVASDTDHQKLPGNVRSGFVLSRFVPSVKPWGIKPPAG